MVDTLYKSELSSTYKSEVFMICVSFSSSKRGKTELPILKGDCALFCLRPRHTMGQMAATNPLVCTDAAIGHLFGAHNLFWKKGNVN